MRVSLSETEWTDTVLLYFYHFSFCPQLLGNNTRQKKNKLGCFCSRFSSQEECRRRKCYHEKMEAIRPSTSESEQKSIEENICFAFFHTRFCRPYVLQEKKKKRVKVRLNRRQFRWVFVDWLKSKIKKKKKQEKEKNKTKKKKDLKKCGSNFCGEGNIGQNSLTKRTNFAPGCPVTSKQCIHKLGRKEDPGGGDSRMKVTGVLVGKFKLNP